VPKILKNLWASQTEHDDFQSKNRRIVWMCRFHRRMDYMGLGLIKREYLRVIRFFKSVQHARNVASGRLKSCVLTTRSERAGVKKVRA
jgi:hypothetical protein